KVDGRVIPAEDIKRFLAHGLGGKQEDHDKFEVILAQEIERRKAAGEDVSKYAATQADVDLKLEKDRKDFALKYPTLDFATEVGRAFLSVDLSREKVAKAIEFDRLFTPDDPDQWPPLTVEIVKEQGAQGGGDANGLIDGARESYQARKKRMEDEHLTEM